MYANTLGSDQCAHSKTDRYEIMCLEACVTKGMQVLDTCPLDMIYGVLIHIVVLHYMTTLCSHTQPKNHTTKPHTHTHTTTHIRTHTHMGLDNTNSYREQCLLYVFCGV